MSWGIPRSPGGGSSGSMSPRSPGSRRSPQSAGGGYCSPRSPGGAAGKGPHVTATVRVEVPNEWGCAKVLLEHKVTGNGVRDVAPVQKRWSIHASGSPRDDPLRAAVPANPRLASLWRLRVTFQNGVKISQTNWIRTPLVTTGCAIIVGPQGWQIVNVAAGGIILENTAWKQCPVQIIPDLSFAGSDWGDACSLSLEHVYVTGNTGPGEKERRVWVEEAFQLAAYPVSATRPPRMSSGLQTGVDEDVVRGGTGSGGGGSWTFRNEGASTTWLSVPSQCPDPFALGTGRSRLRFSLQFAHTASQKRSVQLNPEEVVDPKAAAAAGGGGGGRRLDKNGWLELNLNQKYSQRIGGQAIRLCASSSGWHLYVDGELECCGHWGSGGVQQKDLEMAVLFARSSLMPASLSCSALATEELPLACQVMADAGHDIETVYEEDPLTGLRCVLTRLHRTAFIAFGGVGIAGLQSAADAERGMTPWPWAAEDASHVLVSGEHLHSLERFSPFLDMHLKKKQFARIIITGHLRGGGVATLAALYAASRLGLSNVRLFTFGAPPIGTEGFSAYFNRFQSNITATRYDVSSTQARLDRLPGQVPTCVGLEHVTPCLPLCGAPGFPWQNTESLGWENVPFGKLSDKETWAESYKPLTASMLR